MTMLGIQGTQGSAAVEVRLTFLREELLYDLRQYGYVEGDVTLDDAPDANHRRHQTQDIGEEGNADLVTRVLDAAFEECVNFLLYFARVSVEGGDSMDDRLVAREEYIAVLNVPENFSRTVIGLLAKKIHDYMVCRVLERWLLITNPGAAPKWRVLYEEIAEDIKDTRFTDDGGARRPLYPSW